MSSENKAPMTAFDALVERMKRDVAGLDATKPEAQKNASSRLQTVLDAAIREAREKAINVREAVGDGAEQLRAEMKSHPAAAVSAAFAAGYVIGKSIAGMART